ncbi:ABC transporter substrate-binding protein [Vogesella sp. LIG4]|uniref:substrate-binding periplasmic protein n=1 Tax=Vogesella sp. LIG4 TaxID=1192162 RepID=UPI00081FFE21|nr:ABC transporter substrate-binding protein [Vogesella sp. LIG4]SCK21113.1 polar amino acid transport system substrate-binding protein [Vogesella sp. LIG4]
MRLRPLAALVLACSLPTLAQPEVRLASDDWCPFICASSQQLVGGYLVDASREILENAGYRQVPVFLPLNRAMLMTEQGAIHGVFAPSLDKRLKTSQPLATSRACFYTLADNNWQYRSRDSLKDISLSVIDSYGYDGGSFDQFLAEARMHPRAGIQFRTGDKAGESSVRMLLARRLPVVLEHEAVMSYLLKAIGPDSGKRVRNAGCLDNALPLVIGIGKSIPDADTLLNVINSGIARLHKSGRQRQLMQQYGLLP